MRPDPRPPSWRPKDGDIITGKLVRYEKGPSKFGGDVHIAILEQSGTSDLVGVWLRKVLLGLFKKERPAPGEYLAIKFLGIRKGKRHDYKDYKLALDRDGKGLSFDDEPQDGSPNRAAEFDRSLAELPPEADGSDASDPF